MGKESKLQMSHTNIIFKYRLSEQIHTDDKISNQLEKKFKI